MNGPEEMIVSLRTYQAFEKFYLPGIDPCYEDMRGAMEEEYT